MVVETSHSVAGTFKTLGLPIELSETPGSIRLEPPVLGADTDEVLGEVGYSVTEVGEMRVAGLV